MSPEIQMASHVPFTIDCKVLRRLASMRSSGVQGPTMANETGRPR
jgi:hypothetical protein